jgi:acetyl/propionyl-CoA carboxylase alpha subunit
MMRSIRTVLIANRGEIACRVIRTCHDLGISAVLAASSVDRGSPAARLADRVVVLPDTSGSPYLSIPALLDAARRGGCDAVHPGYGFLSERPEFAEAVVAAGLTWIGPPARAMRAAGDKAAARALAERVGVPVLPGCPPGTDDALIAAAPGIGFPLLVKAVAGGGGRGIRVVTAPDALPDALISARREAAAAFGDDGLLLERRAVTPRHVEVQVFGDAHGAVVHLGERECSIQRRHQKIIEEAPSPAVSPALRERLGAAAVAIASAAGYVGAGTAEFLLEPGGSFWFLEMNARLQVEHPVTELVLGLDLVAWQIAVAEGRPLPAPPPGGWAPVGHAIEARLCAEDSMKGGAPSIGTALRVDVPVTAGVRVDAGLTHGGEVTPHYDSMVAKIIAYGDDRAQAIRRLSRAVTRAWVPGLSTNAPLLRQIVCDEDFLGGSLDTGFLERRSLPRPPPLGLHEGALVATAWAFASRRARGGVPDELIGLRVEGPRWQEDRWRTGPEEVVVRWRRAGGAGVLEVMVGDAPAVRVDVEAPVGDLLRIEVDGVGRTVRVVASAEPFEDGATVYVHHGDAESMVQLVPRFPAPVTAALDPGSLAAPTPGTVVAVKVAVGDAVRAGDVLVVIEAMKMEQAVRAPHHGVVAAVRVAVGDAVRQGDVLLAVSSEQQTDA